jgi:methyl-accepting chemotaxis protein
MTIGKRFILTSGVLMLLSIIMAAVAMFGFNAVGNNIHSLATDTIPGIVYGNAMNNDLDEIRVFELRHIIATTPEEMQQIEQTLANDHAKLEQDMKSYETHLVQEEDKRNFAKVKPLLDTVDAGWANVITLSHANKTAEAMKVYLTSVRPPLLTLSDQLNTMVEWSKQGSNESIASTNSTMKSSWWLLLITSIIVVVAGVSISWFMVAALNKQMTQTVSELTEGAEQIASAASQVSSSSQSLAQGSSEQAASIEETSASSEEINSMARKNTDNSRVMATLMTQSQEMFVRTNHQLKDMVISMDEINDSSSKISKIIKVIDEIAFQTNILALNAAVEAARAGQAGMGFAVVADEVRSLAQRSAQAAKDTTLLIEESIAKSNAGKEKVDQVATAIQSITTDSAKIKTLVDEVSLGSEEQSRGLEQISRAITQMEQVTQTTAANAEESAAAAEELNAQSEALREIVTRLNAMVGGQEKNHSSAFRSQSKAPASRPGRFSAAPAAFRSRSSSDDNNKALPLETAFHEF